MFLGERQIGERVAEGRVRATSGFATHGTREQRKGLLGATGLP
jgi:hypothetical protein